MTLKANFVDMDEVFRKEHLPYEIQCPLFRFLLILYLY